MDTVYIVWVRRQWGYTVYVNQKTGTGRAARRHLKGTYHVPDAQGTASPTALLRVLADEMALPPMRRWNPPPA